MTSWLGFFGPLVGWHAAKMILFFGLPLDLPFFGLPLDLPVLSGYVSFVGLIGLPEG
jgi:hypothetical protein